MLKTKLSVRLDTDLLKRAKTLARRYKMTLTQFITMALLRKVIGHEKSGLQALMIIVMGATLMLAGCSGLILKDEDSAAATTGKVAARVILLPVTFGFSELIIATTKQRDAEQRYVDSMTREEYAHYRDQKAMAAAMFLGSGGFRYTPIQPYQPPVSQVPRQLNCHSTANGSQVYTTCY